LSDNETGLLIPKKEGEGLRVVKFDNPTEPAYQNSDFIIAIYGLLCEVSGQKNQSRSKMQLVKQAMKRNNVTIEEAIEGFWGAYSDPYVKDGDIQWRHIWKHVEKLRDQRPQYKSIEPYKGQEINQ
jgi:hypothetical protein